jgi:O-antigen biosynthesis protein
MNHFIRSDIQTDHFTSHSALLDVYEMLFHNIRWTQDSVLEIGTNDGGGIKMYSDYFQNAKAFGMDILPTPEALKKYPRIVHHCRDAYTVESIELMKSLGRDFALIVDDGPHTLESQLWFCEHYPHLLSPDGLAVVEDIQEYAWTEQFFKKVPSGFIGITIDLRSVNNRWDDILFVIRRKQ